MKRILDLRLKVADILEYIFDTGVIILMYSGLNWLFDSKILVGILVGILRVFIKEYAKTMPEKPKRNKQKFCDNHKKEERVIGFKAQ